MPATTGVSVTVPGDAVVAHPALGLGGAEAGAEVGTALRADGLPPPAIELGAVELGAVELVDPPQAASAMGTTSTTNSGTSLVRRPRRRRPTSTRRCPPLFSRLL
ncbi:MAG: hypothetical protein ACLQPH_20455 [Acidimicrobiales bacterium]